MANRTKQYLTRKRSENVHQPPDDDKSLTGQIAWPEKPPKDVPLHEKQPIDESQSDGSAGAFSATE